MNIELVPPPAAPHLSSKPEHIIISVKPTAPLQVSDIYPQIHTDDLFGFLDLCAYANRTALTGLANHSIAKATELNRLRWRALIQSWHTFLHGSNVGGGVTSDNANNKLLWNSYFTKEYYDYLRPDYMDQVFVDAPSSITYNKPLVLRPKDLDDLVMTPTFSYRPLANLSFVPEQSTMPNTSGSRRSTNHSSKSDNYGNESSSVWDITTAGSVLNSLLASASLLFSLDEDPHHSMTAVAARACSDDVPCWEGSSEYFTNKFNFSQAQHLYRCWLEMAVEDVVKSLPVSIFSLFGKLVQVNQSTGNPFDVFVQLCRLDDPSDSTCASSALPSTSSTLLQSLSEVTATDVLTGMQPAAQHGGVFSELQLELDTAVSECVKSLSTLVKTFIKCTPTHASIGLRSFIMFYAMTCIVRDQICIVTTSLVPDEKNDYRRIHPLVYFVGLLGYYTKFNQTLASFLGSKVDSYHRYWFGTSVAHVIFWEQARQLLQQQNIAANTVPVVRHEEGHLFQRPIQPHRVRQGVLLSRAHVYNDKQLLHTHSRRSPHGVVWCSNKQKHSPTVASFAPYLQQWNQNDRKKDGSASTVTRKDTVTGTTTAKTNSQSSSLLTSSPEYVIQVVLHQHALDALTTILNRHFNLMATVQNSVTDIVAAMRTHHQPKDTSIPLRKASDILKSLPLPLQPMVRLMYQIHKTWQVGQTNTSIHNTMPTSPTSIDSTTKLNCFATLRRCIRHLLTDPLVDSKCVFRERIGVNDTGTNQSSNDMICHGTSSSQCNTTQTTTSSGEKCSAHQQRRAAKKRRNRRNRKERSQECMVCFEVVERLVSPQCGCPAALLCPSCQQTIEDCPFNVEHSSTSSH